MLSTILIDIILISSFTGCTISQNKSNAQQNTPNTTNTTSTNVSPITIASEKIIPSVVGITTTFASNRNKEVQGVECGMINAGTVALSLLAILL